MNDATAVETVDVEDVVEVDAETTEETEAKVDGDGEQVTEPSESSTEKEDGVQKRIDELTRLRRDIERDRDEIAEQRDYWKGKAEETPTPFVPGKSLSDFDYDEGKYSAYVLEEAQSQAKAETSESESRNTQARRNADFKSKESAYADTLDDYYTVAHGPIQVSQDMATVIQDAQKGPEVLYYLGKNPEVAAELASMPPHVMAMEIGRIETKLVKPKPSPTKAKPPAPKIKGADPKTEKNPSDMSDSEFAKWRAKTISQRK